VQRWDDDCDSEIDDSCLSGDAEFVKDDADGCGCNVSGYTDWLAWLLAMALLVRRRSWPNTDKGVAM